MILMQNLNKVNTIKEKVHDIKPHEIPLPPDSSDEDYDPDIYPKGTSLDIRRDEGDKDHIKSFVSYSDDEAEKEKKEKRSELNFADV